MSTVYDEGPYRNWAGINFPGGYYVQIGQDDAAERSLSILKGTEASPAETSSASEFLGVITGVTSGAQIDLSLFSITANPSLGFPTYPVCEASVSNVYQYPSAVAVGAAPWIGASVNQNGALGRAYVLSRASWTASAPIFCLTDSNAPALPAFIDGEAVTISI